MIWRVMEIPEKVHLRQWRRLKPASHEGWKVWKGTGEKRLGLMTSNWCPHPEFTPKNFTDHRDCSSAHKHKAPHHFFKVFLLMRILNTVSELLQISVNRLYRPRQWDRTLGGTPSSSPELGCGLLGSQLVKLNLGGNSNVLKIRSENSRRTSLKITKHQGWGSIQAMEDRSSFFTFIFLLWLFHHQ